MAAYLPLQPLSRGCNENVNENVLNLQARVEKEMSREEGTLARTVNGDGGATLCRRRRRGVEAPYPSPQPLSRGCNEKE